MLASNRDEVTLDPVAANRSGVAWAVSLESAPFGLSPPNPVDEEKLIFPAIGLEQANWR